MNEKFSFRNPVPADMGQIINLGLISYGQFKDTLTADNWEKLSNNMQNESTFTDLIKLPDAFVCEHNEKIVGMAFLVPSGKPSELFQTDWSHIRLVGVDPAYGGKGIGKKLTELCIDAARRTGEKTIALHTSEFMDAARHIYEQAGFKRLKEIAPRLGKRYWIYTLDL